ncbi:HIT family protein [Dactylosporangium sp. NPDC000555]|uniref:HIT family protein n=1 Tax=Dactylosporangium sp. NPDC000555 TaxID=3154260 RepID=UPI003317B4F4
MSCFSCDRNERAGELPPRERIGLDEHWRVAHAFDTALPGWLILLPLRHVTAVADLTDAEAGGLGAWQARLSRALRDVTGCEKTYVVQFAEKEGFAHVHFHLIPRMPGLPAQRRGPRIFELLGVPEADRVPEAERDALAVALRQRLH